MPREPRPRETLREVKAVLRSLMCHGLADEVFDPVLDERNGEALVRSPNRTTATVLGDFSYKELYESQLEERCYAARMLDGALLQIDYTFRGTKLLKHRLAFLPSPDLEPFFELQEEYFAGITFLEAVGRQVSPVPIRIDFDGREGVARPIRHPACHLTLGQYRHCRIPLSGPMRPAIFVDFVVSHLYSVPDVIEFSLETSSSVSFKETLAAEESNLSYLRVAP